MLLRALMRSCVPSCAPSCRYDSDDEGKEGDEAEGELGALDPLAAPEGGDGSQPAAARWLQVPLDCGEDDSLWTT